MLKRMMFAWMIVAVLVLTPSFAMAIPDLQLYIEDGKYDTTSGTWVTMDEDFVLTAFATEPTTDVRLCIALSDELFTLDGGGNVILDPDTTITVQLESGPPITQGDLNFVYGLPPISTINPDGGGGDLGPHDIFPTAFAEIKDIDIVTAGDIFDTQPLSTDPLTFGPTQSGYVYDFLISDAVAGIHFDLYTLDSEDRIDKFAPFTHDAEIVPEPSTLALLGVGILLLPVGKYFRRKSRSE